MNLRHNCGLFGVYGHDDAARMVYIGLYSLQHRGQESAGIVSSDGERFYSRRSLGLVNEVFDDLNLRNITGRIAIGHNRYSTTGSPRTSNVQPLIVDIKGRPLAIAHNGNLVNAVDLRKSMQESGSIFQSSTDSEVFVHLMARSSQRSAERMILETASKVRGAYSLLLMTTDSIIALRDPNGFRPLCMGKKDGSVVFGSETCALDIVGASFESEVEPGEIVIADATGVRRQRFARADRLSLCVFELIYFSRPDSLVFGLSVDAVRKAFGKRLAIEQPADADIVISVPDSSNAAALGYSVGSGIPFELGLIRNHYVGRTFIYPTSELRNNRVRIKFNPVRELLKGKRVVVVDDSIVRGTTSKKLMAMLRDVGVKEIHVRISSPPICYPCFYGIDTPTRTELIAANCSVEEIRRFLEVDTLGYLSVDGMLEATGRSFNDFCAACFTGDYPVPFNAEPSKLALEGFSE
ncbi:MAG: amidophosphoribosyltransferase [bacterium]